MPLEPIIESGYDSNPDDEFFGDAESVGGEEQDSKYANPKSLAQYEYEQIPMGLSICFSFVAQG